MPPMGVYKAGRPSVLTMLVGKLALEPTHAFFVSLLFVLY